MKRILFFLPVIFFCLIKTTVAAEVPTAPYLPAQEKTAPADSPITIQYPYEKMTVSRGAKKIFVLGKVNLPAPVSLTINEEPVSVHSNGAFVAFVPVENGEFLLVLTAQSNGKSYQAQRRVIVPGTSLQNLSDRAAFDKEEVFPLSAVEALPGDTLDLYARGTPHAQVTATLPGFKNARNIPLKEEASSPGIYRAQYVIAADQKPKTSKVVYRMKDGPNHSSAKITAPDKVTILASQKALRTAQILSPAVKLRKIPTERENLYPFYRAYGKVQVNGRLNNQYRLRLNEQETAWLESSKLRLLNEEDPFPLNQINHFTQLVSADKTRIVFSGLHAVPISVHEFNDRLELTFYYTENFAENFSLDATSPLIENTLWSQPAENTVLFKIYFKPNKRPWGHAYDFENGNLVLDLIHQPVLSPTAKKPLTGARILLDAGHSPKRTVPYDGAVGPSGYLEYEATLALAQDLKSLLEKQGATVILTRHGNNRMSLQDRYQLALKEQAHIFISLHYNALPETINPLARARGYCVYYNYPHSFPLAQAVYQAFTKRVPLPDNGMIANDVLFIPRIAQMPSILVENAYLILPEQEEMARSSAGRKVFVQALYEGILNFYGVKIPASNKQKNTKRRRSKPQKPAVIKPAQLAVKAAN
ncbi:MAG: N-acetylmuramoyl-L-alanine amidase [Elusimicrobiaceae bacterium]|nr:N-acetylmuramoyl-L-alanine amidase [Elusimicrobiaceae bacterium]